MVSIFRKLLAGHGTFLRSTNNEPVLETSNMIAATVIAPSAQEGAKSLKERLSQNVKSALQCPHNASNSNTSFQSYSGNRCIIFVVVES